MIPQAHVAATEEECSCPWCGQWIAAGDWLYQGQYCSSSCWDNDAQRRSAKAVITRFRIKHNRSPWRPIES